MRFDRLSTLGVVNPFFRITGQFAARNSRPAANYSPLPILMYHSISDDPESDSQPYFKVCTSPRRFADHMQWLADLGYQGVNLNQGLAALQQQQTRSHDD